VAADTTPTDAPFNDVRDLTRLLGHHADATILAVTQGLHRAISSRVFRWVPGSHPVRWSHDAISHLTYASVRVDLRGLARAGEAVAAVAAGDREVRWLDSSPAHSRAASILHGVIGDRFATDQPALDLPVSIRVAGRTTDVAAEAVAAGFPDPSPRVAVFLHGLTESDCCWDNDDGVVLPDVVDELGWTPVRLRYGSGRSIGTNGAELDALLEDLLDVWPVPVTELTLIGHSMGGLVIRAACQLAGAADDGRRWPALVRHTVHLGTPHLGSWLERAANTGTRLLRRIPEGEVVAQVIDTRARGIKDLRHGALGDDCWGEGVVHEDGIGGLDGFVPAPGEVAPLLDHATHHLVAGRLTRSPDHPVARIIGDSLVTAPSALGDDGRRALAGGRIETLELPAGHFRLMRHPAVAAHLRHWLA
jgi:hypothetical protein